MQCMFPVSVKYILAEKQAFEILGRSMMCTRMSLRLLVEDFTDGCSLVVESGDIDYFVTG